MSGYLQLDKSLQQYILSHTREPEIARRLRSETASLPQSGMQTMPDQVALLSLLVRITQAKRVIEIGTFTGYSALAMASALPKDGKLIACDTSKQWTDIAKRYWQEAGVAACIHLRVAPAQETLAALLTEGMAGTVDFIFIDGDKTGYDAYYEAALKLLRKGGLIAFDNMLWGGAVADASEQDTDTKALRALNDKIHKDERIESCLLTVADGMVLAQKR